MTEYIADLSDIRYYYPDLYTFINEKNPVIIPSLKLHPKKAQSFKTMAKYFLFGIVVNLIFYLIDGQINRDLIIVDCIYFSTLLLYILSISMPNSSYMVVDSNCINVRHLYRNVKYYWENIEKFAVGDLGIIRDLNQLESIESIEDKDDIVVKIYFTKEYLFQKGQSRPFNSIFDHYGIEPTSLAFILNKCLNIYRENI